MDLNDLELWGDGMAEASALYWRVMTVKLKIAKAVGSEDPLVLIPAMIEMAAAISAAFAASSARGGEFLDELIDGASTLYADLARAEFAKVAAAPLMLRYPPVDVK